MSISKPTAAELQEWNERLADEGLSERRGESHRVVYGGDDTTRLAEITWRKAKIWIKRKRKIHHTVERTCLVCLEVFLGRADGLFCSAACCQKRYRYSKRTGVRGATNV